MCDHISQPFQADIQGTQPLRPFFENIIDKKVNQVALSRFERFIDFLCFYCSASYNQRLTYRLSELDLDKVDMDKELDDDDADSAAQAVAEKVHYFMDGAPLYDRTATQRIAIEHPKLFDLISEKNYLGEDQIMVDGKPVYFDPNAKRKLLFGKNYNTKEVFVTDVKECPELVMIYEREMTGQLKAWCVDTSQPTKKVVMGGQLVIGQPEDVFYAEGIAQNPPPQIVDTFP